MAFIVYALGLLQIIFVYLCSNVLCKCVRLSGNENLHDLTTNNGLNFALRIELTDNFGLSLYADYEYFAVQDEVSKYLLTLGLPMNTSTLGENSGRVAAQ